MLGGRRAATGGAPDGLDRPPWRRRVRDPHARGDRKRRGARRDARPQAAVRKGRGVDRHGLLSDARLGLGHAAAPRRPPAVREQARRCRALRGRAARADLGGDARPRGGRAHGDSRSSIRRSSRATPPARPSGWAGAAPTSRTSAIAAMLHDIGKVVLPDRILQKPEALDPIEFEEVKRHPRPARS